MLNHPQALIPTVLLAAAAAVFSAAVPARAQSTDVSGLRADMIADVSTMESKYVGLAEAIPASAYDWSPMEGVRSVGEVFCHMAAANFGIPRFFGVEAPAEAKALEAKCDTEDLAALKQGAVEALSESFVFARKAIAAVPDQFADEISLSGPRDRIRERVKDWENSPVTSLLVSGEVEMLRALAELVL